MSDWTHKHKKSNCIDINILYHLNKEYKTYSVNPHDSNNWDAIKFSFEINIYKNIYNPNFNYDIQGNT